MAKIAPFVRRDSFDPEMNQALAAALDSAWHQLQAAGHAAAMPHRAASTREQMAVALLNQGRIGVTDPQLLVAAAMEAVLGQPIIIPTETPDQPSPTAA